MNKLAILGGEPAFKGKFAASVVVGDEEHKYIDEVLDREEFSRFMGSPTADIDNLLVMPSADAHREINQYFTFLGGEKVRRFEAEFAGKFGSRYAISVNSATSGLSTALAAVGCGPGDEVVTTCLSFNATAMSILAFNSIPIFVDVDPETYCLDPLKLEAAISKRTKAILVVHLLGIPAEMDSIKALARERGLAVVEDCAQAPGSCYKGCPVGTIGDAGVFSFQETKNMMTGEGGIILTDNPGIAKRARLIRNHGESIPDDNWSKDDLANLVGFNFRMTELTAALGLAQLHKLDENNRVRSENAAYLAERLKGLPGLKVKRFDREWVPHVLPMIYDASITGVTRSTVIKALRTEGIPVGSGYMRLMNENPLFQQLVAYGRNGCPWKCRPEQVPDYGSAGLPVASKLIREAFIWFYHIHRPNSIEDMALVAIAFEKVFGAMHLLREWRDDGMGIEYKW